MVQPWGMGNHEEEGLCGRQSVGGGAPQCFSKEHAGTVGLEGRDKQQST